MSEFLQNIILKIEMKLEEDLSRILIHKTLKIKHLKGEFKGEI